MTVNAPGDAGAEVTKDAEIEATSPPADLSGSEAGSASCLQADPGAPQPTVPPVSMLSPACQTYCAAMQQNCDRVYGTVARCWYACQLLDWPASGDTGQDTVACRTSFAQDPTTDPFTRSKYCEAASPVLTGGACGDVCAVYCRSGARICPGSFPAEATCRSGCEAEKVRFDQKIRENPDGGGSHDFPSKMRCRIDRLQTAIFNKTYCDVAAPNKMCGECADLDFTP
jgi:hypothetical protein